MTRLIRHIAAALLSLLVLCPGFAAKAGPALLFDPHKGTVLYQEDIDSLWHPASLTKLMTAYL
ncbi:MAG: D-alanyl-D-alanine carboxypeptidase, partial [Alphaproteobacteria bacterium]